MSLKWVEVFKGGTRTSSNGVTRTYTPQELDQVVETYNPDHFKAPLIVSYPAHNTAGFSDRELHKSQLAFGFPQQLKRAGDTLLAGFQKISPKVKEWISNGEILGFSSSFYLPNSPHNPYPGKLALRHIAGCGVDPPAVKGMASPEFGEPLSAFANYAEDQEGSVEFALDVDEQTLKDAQLGVKVYKALRAVDEAVSFGENGAIATIIRDMFQRLRDRHIEDKSIEEADKLYPPYILEQLGAIASQPYVSHPTWDDFMQLQQSVSQLSNSGASYQEKSPMPEEKQELDAQFSELKARNEALEQQNELLVRRVTDLELLNERQRVTSFVENAIRDRKIYPNERDSEIRDILALNHAETADYGEAGQLTARERYMQKIGDRKPLWNVKNNLPIGPEHDPESFSESELNFTVPPGYDVDPIQAALYQKAIAYQSEKNVSFSEAVAAVTKGVRN